MGTFHPPGDASAFHDRPMSSDRVLHRLVHTLGAPVQLQPGSIMQLEEQPSPLSVLPSSHCLPNSTLPSPQAGTQGLPGTGQTQPGSIAEQSPSQPSPLSVFPSSQTSGGTTMPSAQMAFLMQGLPGVEQMYPISI